LRENPKVVFVPIDKKILEVVLLIGTIFVATSTWIIQDTTSSADDTVLAVFQLRRTDPSVAPDDVSGFKSNTVEVSLWYTWVIDSGLVFLIFFLADRYYRGLRQLRERLINFDVANTKLTSERDRPLLLSIVNELFEGRRSPQPVEETQNAAPVLDPSELGQTLHAHILTSQASPSTQQEEVEEPISSFEPSQSSLEVPSLQASNRGLESFNRSVKVNVQNQLQLSGIKAFRLVGYRMAVLIGGVWIACNYFDSWGFIDTGNLDSGTSKIGTIPYQGWRSVVALAYLVLVLTPFYYFLLSAEVKLFLKLYEWSGWPRWTKYVVFFPLFFFVEIILYFRVLVAQNLTRTIFADLIAGTATPHQFTYIPFFGLTYAFLFVYHDYSKPVPQWYYGFTWTFQKNALTDSLLWVFLVIPLTIFTYWVYEPNILRRYRAKCWKFLVQKLFASTDRSRSDSRV
jgi:hypothetical protein